MAAKFRLTPEADSQLGSVVSRAAELSSARPLILTAFGTMATSCSIIVESFKIFAAHLGRLAVLAEREIYDTGQRDRRVAAQDDRRSRQRGALDRRRFAVGMKTLLIGHRRHDDRRGHRTSQDWSTSPATD